MCYNKMYAPTVPVAGQLAVSRMGHDKNRVYIVIAVLNADFVLCVDGKYRTVEKPKQKRVKHLKFGEVSQAAAKAIEQGKLTDATVTKVVKAFVTKQEQ